MDREGRGHILDFRREKQDSGSSEIEERVNIGAHQHGDLSGLTAISQGEGKKPRIKTEAREVKKGRQISGRGMCANSHREMDGRNTGENASWLKKSIMV